MASLTSLYYHLVLPVNVPDHPDKDPEAVSAAILRRVIKACALMRKLRREDEAEIWSTVRRSLHMSQGIDEIRLDRQNLLQKWADLQFDDLLIVRITQQNAALLIRTENRYVKLEKSPTHAMLYWTKDLTRTPYSDDEAVVIFEVFETSPCAKDVLAADALQWDFPGRAVEMPLVEFQDSSLQENLATCLEQAAEEPLQRFAARVIKAGASVIENRDTTDPGFVVQFLMPLFEAMGRSIKAPMIRKRVRDEVHIQKSQLPWRRDPSWLVLRVAIQRQLFFILGYERGRICYKFLICLILAQLLDDCSGSLSPEMTITLRAKLCRRLAKLEMDKSRVTSDTTLALYKHLFASVGSCCEKTVTNATQKVETAWASYKKSISRDVPPLPMHAKGETLKLSLPHSGPYLENLLTLSQPSRTNRSSVRLPLLSNSCIKQARKLTDHYFELAELEESVQFDDSPLEISKRVCQSRCEMLAESICELIQTGRGVYASKPEQMGIFLLRVFELWASMDKHAIIACPLLESYHPIFTPEALDVLQLPVLSDMSRLQAVQRYLKQRCDACTYKLQTVFSNPNATCFAAMYLEHEDSTRVLGDLMVGIEEDSESSHHLKAQEWEEKCREYDDLTARISAGTCTCTFVDGIRDVRDCTKCYHWRRRKRMTIDLHEDYLPTGPGEAATVVFELSIPSYIQAYRNATWMTLKDLAHPSVPKPSTAPQMLLEEYSQLSPYMSTDAHGISLASVKKSFLSTHFKTVKMRADLKDILRPLGLEFSYYDQASSVWLHDLRAPITFRHLCGVHIPPSLVKSVIDVPAHPPPWFDGPTSYETIASQAKCPSDMSVHEFTALQRLLAGTNRRWMTMLVELGSSNINFSAEDTMYLFNSLVMQAGPTRHTNDVLRDAHVVFRDELFCQRLAEQIEKRLRTIKPNWRETHCMEILLTMILRLHDLTTGAIRQNAYRLLRAARMATLDWISRLRVEFRNAKNDNTAKRVAEYGFWAALLCRRTYAVVAGSKGPLNSSDLCSFVEASVALQENLFVDPTKLTPYLTSMLMRDMKMMYQIRLILRDSVMANFRSIGEALSLILSGPQTARNFHGWKFLLKPDEFWVESRMKSKEACDDRQQLVHYNILEGHLFIDGKPLGRLPPEIRESPDVKELFGDKHLRTYPSNLAGMEHQLDHATEDHHVHFGRRGNNVIIRALTKHGLLEFIPRHVFRGGSGIDLPAALVDECVHWFNLHTKKLDIRKKPSIWKTRMSDWVLDLSTRRAVRRQSYLVDPYSGVCGQIQKIFRDFEDPHHLTIFQPEKGKLTVELRRLELSFTVNRDHLLECRQLSAEIDPNQDAGTLYGLESKIVLRDMVDSSRRSIITRLGHLETEIRGMHVSVRVKDGVSYGKFGIDSVLGRLSCPPEPRLLYSKALFHAITSFILPDPLTRCTGTEEAYHLLSSGLCQPWTSIRQIHVKSILHEIQQLSPARVYYPKDKRCLQTVRWNPNLTVTIQHDSFCPLIKKILAKSDKLALFDGQSSSTGDVVDESESDEHLSHRGEIRRSLYERGLADANVQPNTQQDGVYKPRDRHAASVEAKHVFQTVQILQQQQPFAVSLSIDFAQILRDFPDSVIGGFNEESGGPATSLSKAIGDGLGEQWGSLVNFCREIVPGNLYKAVFRLGLLSFAEKQDMSAIRVLCAFVLSDELKQLEPPKSSSFQGFREYSPPTIEHIAKFVCTDDDIVRTEWHRLYNNQLLLLYAEDVQAILGHHAGGRATSKPSPWNTRPESSHGTSRECVLPSISRELLLKSSVLFSMTSSGENMTLPVREDVHQASERAPEAKETTPPAEIHELESILSSFVESPKHLWQQYGTDLLESLSALRAVSEHDNQDNVLPPLHEINQQIEKFKQVISTGLYAILTDLNFGDIRFSWLWKANMWPHPTTTILLEQLRSSANVAFGHGMKEVIVTYGLLITKLQWLLRLKHERLRHDEDKLLEHWRDKGHENWSAMDHPDWLLLEIDSDLLIRREQVEVAKAIISPSSCSNSVLQLNMGKGKTSCIVPMAVAVLANSKNICRLIVPKALLLQTGQTLQARIGGLIGRELRHIPFSRRTPTTTEMLKHFNELHMEMLRSSGVVLAIPEHILSYKLSGFQRLADARLGEARTMVKTQSQLTSICRDVLDESDFTLAVKTQLIYPSGQLLSVDGHPGRWTVAQDLLSLVVDHLSELRRRFPRGIDVVERPQGFPMIHIIHTDVEDVLHQTLVKMICDGRTAILPLPSGFPKSSRIDIERILTEENPDAKVFDRVSRMFTTKSSTYGHILLVRGLLVNRILFICLKKRWNVQYGLHPTRVPIAVPFEAKGVPSEQAEFGHPDVAILFTCLAFYYSGLTLPQFREGLGHVLRSDDPASEYDRWTAGCDGLPESLQHWNVINIDDAGQLEELWRRLRLSKNVLNHYMNIFIFPIHAKQFNTKLQSSGWDIPIFSLDDKDDKTRMSRTTGFSGTNDNRRLLPLTVRQDDLPSLSQTNAEVLTYLLLERNRTYMVAAAPDGRRLTEDGLLHKLNDKGIRVLIDAGACILEMDNATLAKKWLAIDHTAEAAVYFDADNRPWVMFRKGKERVPLLATPFAEGLENCLVYLDEAHTRGTDLKFPRHICGAVTLALGQTKDHTVQAAMRLRQLATTQAVMFIAPPEVNQSIKDLCKPKKDEKIDSSHVVRWLLEQTCRSNEQLQGMYVSQGLDFCRRMNAMSENPKFAFVDAQGRALLKIHQSPEQLTLEQLYGPPAVNGHRNNLDKVSHSGLQTIVQELTKQRQSVNGNSLVLGSAMEEVEQEREVEYQVEEIGEVHKPAHYRALKFQSLHPTVSRFVSTGVLSGVEGFQHVFACLGSTSIGRTRNLNTTGSRLFVSTEFTRTVELGSRGADDNYFRPVEWIVWSSTTETALVVIPEEAELLIPLIREGRQPKTCLIGYAAPTTKTMLHFNALTYYTLPEQPDGFVFPTWLSIEVGILAARLYFDYREYGPLMDYFRTTNGPRSDVDIVSHEGATNTNDLSEFLLD